MPPKVRTLADRTHLISGHHLAVLPITRLKVGYSPLVFSRGITFYPPGQVSLDDLNIHRNVVGNSLAEAASAFSRVDADTLESHPLIVFPRLFDWEAFRKSGFREHHRFIRTLSEYVDRECLNLIRYQECSLEFVHDLPGRAGMVKTNSMMAGALLYNHSIGEARIVAGDVFSHRITRGLGLELSWVDRRDYEIGNGEVGNIARMGLQHYAALLETDNQSQKFVHAMGLLEFLAYPDDFKKFQDVKKVVASYVASDRGEYERHLKRFLELTGKKNDQTGKHEGFRTRLVHLGQRLEDILPDEASRKSLFAEELQVYIKAVIDHMLQHADKTWEEYLCLRPRFDPKAK